MCQHLKQVQRLQSTSLLDLYHLITDVSLFSLRLLGVKYTEEKSEEHYGSQTHIVQLLKIFNKMANTFKIKLWHLHQIFLSMNQNTEIK